MARKRRAAALVAAMAIGAGLLGAWHWGGGHHAATPNAGWAWGDDAAAVSSD
jgi:hypothetical protein